MSESKLEVYNNCLLKSKGKNMKLCPRGYCTAKSKFKVYPSAYANGYASQVCNGSKSDFTGVKHNDYGNSDRDANSDLTRWYNEKWVNVCDLDNQGKYRPCGRPNAKLHQKNYPYCRPMYKLPGTSVKSVGELTQMELKKMCDRKRSIIPGVNGAPTRVYVANMLIKNPSTGRIVKSNGVTGGNIQQQIGGGKKFLPNMTLVHEYNKNRGKQRKATYRNSYVTLYVPEISDKSLKKLKVYVEDPDTGQIKRIDFGHTDYQDYTIHRDTDRQDSYCARSNGIRCSGKQCDINSANYWSRMVLWDC